MKNIYRAIVAACFCLPFVASAQLGSSAQLTVTPAFVNPGDQISVALEAYSLDLNSARVEWFVNGDRYPTTGSERQIAVRLGEAGEPSTVTAVIVTVDGAEIRLNRTITPASVALVWEADTYTPPLYKGRPLFTSQSTLTLLAIPNLVQNGRQLSSSEVVYTWEQDGVVLGSKSGRGKNTLTLAGSILSRPEIITVEATSQDGSVSARKRITVPISNSFVRVYEESPLYGVRFNTRVDDGTVVAAEEITLRAYPFFAPVDHPRALNWTWTIGDVETYTPDITLRNTTTESTGEVSVGVAMRHAELLLHSAQSSIDLIFE